MTKTTIKTLDTAEESFRAVKDRLERGPAAPAAPVRARPFYKDIPLDLIERDPKQQRRYFSEEALKALAASIQASGLSNAIEVYPVAFDDLGTPTRYRIHSGERRWRAHQHLGAQTIHCKIMPRAEDFDSPDSELLRVRSQRAENVDREGFTILDDANSLNSVIEAELSAAAARGEATTRQEITTAVAREARITDTEMFRRLSLLGTPAALQRAVATDDPKTSISRAAAYSLAAYWRVLVKKFQEEPGAKKMKAMFDSVVAYMETQRGRQDGSDQTTPEVQEGADDADIEADLRPFVRGYCELAQKKTADVKTALSGHFRRNKEMHRRFEQLVESAVKNRLTAANIDGLTERLRRSKRLREAEQAADGKLAAAEEISRPPLFESSGTGARSRIVVYPARLRDPLCATDAARAGLREQLGALMAAVDAGPDAAKSDATTSAPSATTPEAGTPSSDG